MTVDLPWLVPALGATMLVLIVTTGLASTADVHVRHHGRDNRRARRALNRHLRTLADVADEQVVDWCDFAALTKRELVDLLGDHGWYVRGQDMDADGWPLLVIRDSRSSDARHQLTRPGRWGTTDDDRPLGVDGPAHVRTIGGPG